MPRERKTLPPKPGKDKLLVPVGRKETKAENIGEATKGMEPGEARSGFLIGRKNYNTRQPDYMPPPENLTAEETARKKIIRDLLGKIIIPNSLSSKSTPEMDKRSLINKLNRLRLEELISFLPERVLTLTNEQLSQIVAGESDIYEEEKVEIQDKFVKISP